MIHICFAYIRHYKGLRNVCLKVDSHYEYRFDTSSNVLRINTNNDYSKDFWGIGVYSLAAIVGNNGAGKSTSMEFILNTLVDGANTREVDGVLVYEQDGRLLVWGKDVQVETELTYRIIENIPKITCFYYCGHFMPYVTYNDLRSTELAGGYNASDGWMLVRDVQSYSNIDSIRMTLPLYSHLNYFVAQNNHRICTMLADERVRNTVKEFCLPKYVQIGVNESGWYALNEKNRKAELAARQNKSLLSAEIIEIPQKKLVHSDARDRYLEQLLYYNFLNLMNEGLKTNPEDTKNALMAWTDFETDNSHTIKQFERFVKQYDCELGLKEELSAVLYVIKTIDKLCAFFDNGVTQCYYLDTDKDGEQLRTLTEDILNKPFFLTAKFFDLYYSQELGMNTILSSGEQNLLDIFSRLYDALMTSPKKFANIDSKRLILLDEAEIGFHPDWQRKYINLILDFLQTMIMVKPGVDFQVMISTHSPVLLSDIPACCVNYLKVDENGMTRNADAKEARETFAANVFEQYKGSFFMNDGLVGEFARRKLMAVKKDIEDKKANEETKKVIGMIGDARIKDYLLRKMRDQDIDAQIAYHEEKARELRRLKERHHE